MTSHFDSHNTTDIKPEMLSGVQTGNGTPYGKYNIRCIAHARTHRKDDIFMKRQLVQNFTYIMERGQGTCTLTKRTRHWTYSASRHFFLSGRIHIYNIFCYQKIKVSFSNTYNLVYNIRVLEYACVTLE